MTEICFASNNAHKLEEVRQLLLPDFSVLSLEDIHHYDDLAETQDTFEGNSFQKAEFVMKKFNIPCFADDSGLEVQALNGAPGVFSARYAGEHKNNTDNIKLLLKNLEGVSDRQAQFKTVITFLNNNIQQVFEGTLKGTILTAPRGSHGFGYDPVFIPEGHSRSLAEMTAEEKNAISHRGIAVRKLAAWLKENFV